MALTIFPLDFDETGESKVNLVLDEMHLIGPSSTARPVRAVILEKGHFYANSLVIRDEGGKPLQKGIHYRVERLNTEATALTDKTVVAVIVITDPEVTERVWIDAQMVGGRWCFLGGVSSDLLKEVANDNRPLNYHNIVDVPASLKPARHKHAMAQTFGWNPFKEQIDRITAAIKLKNRKDLERVKQELTDLNDAAGRRLDALNTLIEMHLRATNNPHHVTIEQLNLQHYARRIIVVADKAYDSSMRDNFVTPALVAKLFRERVLSEWKSHLEKVDPHHLTLEQVWVDSTEETVRRIGAKYRANEQVSDATHIEGKSYSTVVDELRKNQNASNIKSGILNSARLGEGTADGSKYLQGDGKWTSIKTGMFDRYTQTKPRFFMRVILVLLKGMLLSISLRPTTIGQAILKIPSSFTANRSRSTTTSGILFGVLRVSFHVGLLAHPVGGLRLKPRTMRPFTTSKTRLRM